VRCLCAHSPRRRDAGLMLRPPGRVCGRTLRLLADEELIGHVREGDAVAFEVIFDRHAAAAFSLAYRMCGRRALAEDVVQEAFLSLWRAGMRYERPRGSVRAWVLGVVRHKAIDTFRHEAVRTGRDVHDEAAAERMPARDSTDGEVERLADAEQVRGVLAGLPTDQRHVIELAYFGGFTQSQIADFLELPAGTVKGRMRLGLSKLRLALGAPTGVSS
jgi:RNA polymerase sigma-70 factor, ECF subfamily